MISEKNQYPFLISLYFIISFLAIRLAVLLAGSAESDFAQAAKAGQLPGTNFSIGSNIILFGYHIHHFYFGILLICLAAWIAIVGSTFFTRKHAAIMYGIGLGLFLDEIGLLLTWGDYYSSLSYIISLFVLGIFLNILFLGPFWKSFRHELKTQKTPLARAIRQEGPLFSFIDWSISKISHQESVSQIFRGLVLSTVGILIFIFPQSLHVWIIGLFFFQGLMYMGESIFFKKGETK
ncbi:MAG: hypothetical protein ACMXYA_02015 [Candidatus Woesearchaeota archaeon]